VFNSDHLEQLAASEYPWASIVQVEVHIFSDGLLQIQWLQWLKACTIMTET
jgi:hypothetical protein